MEHLYSRSNSLSLFELLPYLSATFYFWQVRMLTSVVNELSYGFSVIVKDSMEKSGSCLLTALVDGPAARHLKVVTVNTEPVFNNLSVYNNPNVTVLNVFDCYDKILDKVLHAASGQESVVIFPSLSLYLMNTGVTSFAKLVRALQDSSSIKHIAALIHTDVLAVEETLSQAEHMFETIINVLPVETELAGSYYGHVQCVRRKPNGKVDSADEYFSLDENGGLGLVHTSTSAIIKSIEDTNSEDVTANLTFNLSLSNKEREAKNKLLLPYLKKESEKHDLLSKSNK